MPAGRPREYDRNAIGKALLKWAMKDDSLNLNGFCTTHNPLIPPSYLAIWAKEDNRFSIAYETAKAFLACRRERKLTDNELHVKAYDLNASVYDYFLREEKRREKEHEASLKEKDLNKPPPFDDIIDQQNAQMEEMAKIRKENAELKSRLDNKS